MTKTQEELKNSFRLRIYDVETLKSIDELMKTKQFESMNELLNRAVRIGIEKIYVEYGKRRRLTSDDEEKGEAANVRLERIEKKTTEMSLSLDDVLVLMSMVEMLTSTLYNVELSKARGEAISAELLESGYLTTLPEGLQEIKDKLIERSEKKNKERKQ